MFYVPTLADALVARRALLLGVRGPDRVAASVVERRLQAEDDRVEQGQLEDEPGEVLGFIRQAVFVFSKEMVGFIRQVILVIESC